MIHTLPTFTDGRWRRGHEKVQGKLARRRCQSQMYRLESRHVSCVRPIHFSHSSPILESRSTRFLRHLYLSIDHRNSSPISHVFWFVITVPNDPRHLIVEAFSLNFADHAPIVFNPADPKLLDKPLKIKEVGILLNARSLGETY